jgi:pimeloyl-ACP methyl ester carboxylesterase
MSETFELLSGEGLPIRGNFDAPPGARALVIVVHGFKGFKDWGFFPWVAETLCNHGFAVCRFNMSRSGIGENPDAFDRLDLFAHDTYSIQLADLRTVVAFAQSRFAGLPTFLLGHSRGGGIALLGARDVPKLAGVATWSAISHANRWDDGAVRDWRRTGWLDVINARTKQNMRMSTAILDDFEAHRDRLDILHAASLLDVPLLVIHGANDESVPAAEAEEIARRARTSALLIIGKASHTYNAIHPLVDVPFALSLAGLVTAHFVRAYS